MNAPYFEIYRKQVVKQADLILAMHWFGDVFSFEEKARAIEYYDPLTVRDSSLSACTQAVLAAEVGHLELADGLPRRGGDDGHPRPGAQHPRRTAHRLAGGVLAGHRRRLRRDA